MLDWHNVGIVVAFLMYAGLGVLIADASWRVWFEDHTNSTSSFLLFPLSHARNRIGEKAVISVFAESPRDKSGRLRYFLAIGVLWPIKIVANLGIILFVGVVVFCVVVGEQIKFGSLKRRPGTVREQPSTQKTVQFVPPEPKPTDLDPDDLQEELETLLFQRERFREKIRNLNRQIREIETILTEKKGSGKFPRASGTDDAN